MEDQGLNLEVVLLWGRENKDIENNLLVFSLNIIE